MRRWSILGCVFVASTAAWAKPHKRKQPKRAPVVETTLEEDVEIEMPADEPAKPLDEPVGAPNDDEQTDEVAVHQPTKSKRARNEFYFRAGVAHVVPRIATSGMQLQPEGIAKLATPMDPVQGTVETDATTIFVANIGFAPAVFRGHVAFETMIGLPKKAKLRATGDLANKSLAPTALDLVPTGVPPLGEELGEAEAVPPLVTALFRAPALGPVRAYAGGGVSVLFVRNAKVTNKVLTEVATPKLEIDPAFGVVAQAGLDIHVWDRFYARLDFKEMWFQPTETRISNIHVKTTIPLLETVSVGSAKSESQANPYVVQIGIGASF